MLIIRETVVLGIRHIEFLLLFARFSPLNLNALKSSLLIILSKITLCNNIV